MKKGGKPRVITSEELVEELEEQGVPSAAHYAFRCPICSTVHSAASLVFAGAGKTLDEAEKYLGFSCVGKFTGAGRHRNGDPPGRGCDWTLGGLFRIHKLEVIVEGGGPRPCFEPATPEEAQALFAKLMEESERMNNALRSTKEGSSDE